MSKELKRMQELAGVPAKKETESLNEHYMAGGIVGVGAVNQIPPRDKSDYEMAFEHFMNEGEEKGEGVEENLDELIGSYNPETVDFVTGVLPLLAPFLATALGISVAVVRDKIKGARSEREALEKVKDLKKDNEITGTDIDSIDTSEPKFDDEVTGTKLEEENSTMDVKKISDFLPKINNKAEYIELLPKVLDLNPTGVNNAVKLNFLKNYIKKLS